MNYLFVFLQSAPQGGSSLSMWIMILLIFVVMYFFMIRPQNKQRKELEKFLANHRALMPNPNFQGRKMYRLELFEFMHIFGQQLTWGAEAVTVGNVIYYDNGREDHTPWITNQG